MIFFITPADMRNSSGDQERHSGTSCLSLHAVLSHKASNKLNKRLIGTQAWCEKYCQWKKACQMEDLTYIGWWLGVFSVSSVAASGRRWS